jgi:RNA-directed DNA polymerase
LIWILASYFDNVQHSLLLEKVARRVQDDAVMHLLKMILKATGKKGVPQGGVISPLLSNLYLNEVDRMLEKAVDTTRRGKSTNVQYARFADDMVILIDAERRSDWLVKAIDKRLREEFAKLRVEINEDKSRMVDLKKGESFTFLGFEYRRVLSLQRKWRPYYAPKLKKRTALFEKLREIFRQHVSWPVEIVIAKINPILRGWVNYFRVGHSSICFGVVKRWVEEKVRRHLMRARGRKGFGWTRWSSEWLYDRLGLFNDYQLVDGQVRKSLQHDRPHNSWHEANRCAQCGKSARWVRCGGGWKRIHGLAMWRGLRHSQRKRGATARPDLRNTAPVLDPTDPCDNR